MEMQILPKCHLFQAAFIKVIIMADGTATFSWKFCSSFHFCWVLFHNNRRALEKKPRSCVGQREDDKLNNGLSTTTMR